MRQNLASVLAKLFLRLSGVLITIYLGLCISLRFWQTRLIFFPSAEIKSTPAKVNLPYEEVWIPVAKEKIQSWWIPAKTAKAPVLLYFHGNGSNLGDLAERTLRFHQLGLSVLLIDYRGYGNSRGSFPSEASVYEDAEAAWTYLRKTRQIPTNHIFLYGHSLGGAIAIELAQRHPDMAGVIVEATFTSMRAMLNQLSQYQLLPIDWILTQHFDSLTKVRSLQTPILFIHGTSDTTVPAQMSQDLFTATPEPKRLLLVPGSGHNNVARMGGARYLHAVRTFVQQARN